MPAFLLVHSPLVGPYTWGPVADELRRRGHEAVVPRLVNDEQDERTYVEQHEQAIAHAYWEELAGKRVVLVGHSGAGMLLPSAGHAIGNVAGYIFVDADLPSDGASRLDLFLPDDAARIRQASVDGYMPVWVEDRLVEVIPDWKVRGRFMSELRPVPLAVYEETIPVPRSWPDAPCAYLSFGMSDAYAQAVGMARERGWAYGELPGYHFHLLVEPANVAEALVGLAGRLGIMGQGEEHGQSKPGAEI